MARDAEKVKKTNAMRELENHGVSYQVKTYEVDEDDLSGVHAAEVLGEDASQVFKTLVTQSPDKQYAVFMIPVDEELSLKKAAAAAKHKSLSMIQVKELKSVTGYIRGGCSPLAMKKSFPVYIDETAQLFDTIACSGGQRGVQLIVNPEDLARVVGAEFVDLLA
ncbi:MAG: Cys-tRNA(Pro) deacylase [Coriobacteriia bacterium]|nr:Cys-tRNA(Pro) deacylase [Coriobacteriia bacterium]